MKKVSLVVAVVAACAAGSAFAQQGLYVGGSLGQSITTFNSSDFVPTTAGNSNSQEKTKTAYKGFVGYSINQYFAVEGGYANFGKPTSKNAWSGGGSDKAVQEESAWFAAAKGTLPINEQFNLFGKLGMTYNKVTSKWTDTDGANDSTSKSRSGVLYGIGAEYNVTKQVGLRLEYEDFGKFGNATNTGRTNTSMWSLGAAYKF